MCGIKNQLLGLLFSVCACSYTRADKYPVNPWVDIQNYSFSISLYDTTDEISAAATLRVLFKKAGITQLRLDLVNRQDSLEEKGMLVESTSEGEQATRFSHKNNVLLIDLITPSAAGAEMQFTIRYHGRPAAGLMIGPDKDGDRSFFSNDWPNLGRNWLPLVDHPHNKATCEFIVTAPACYQVISNGLKIEETDLEGNRRRTHWRQSVPISSWLFVLGVAKFAVKHGKTFEGKPIQTWIYARERETGFYDLEEITMKVLRYFSDYIGPFAYEKLANVEASKVGGGMETASAIYYDDRIMNGKSDNRLRDVAIHEIAHQWFGNAVTENDWDDVWLSEGFATYFTLLFQEHAYGHDEFINGLLEGRKRVFEFYKKNPAYTIIHENTAEEHEVTTIQTYQKGAWILHMLRNLIGDEAFQNGIRAYYQRFFNATATTTDFKSQMEKASGRDLGQFFRQWLYLGGNVILRGIWRYNESAGILDLQLDQEQNDGFVFDFPVEIGIFQNGKIQPVIKKVHMDSLYGHFSIPVDDRPDKVTIDPRTVLLAQWTVTETK
ncbi:MAG: M1 family metallopeptidase [Bacteroidota bacterium]|nr:M1 family metallopeptidase [Bacteroidota bacterium]MDP4213597.1 M1 family metallopeptidase [Bacteroidota bacterium]MDP4249671.1 M1 family metallopeptidase [Bacteroidota bacterium]